MSKDFQQSPTTPLYSRIESDMRAKVASGVWPSGMMIPSRKALSKDYGVDLRTVQRAISALLADGTLTAENGRGTFVPRGAAGDDTSTAWAQPQSLLTIGIVIDQSFSPTDPGPRAITQAIHALVRRAAPSARILTFDTHAESIEHIAELERDALNIVEHQGLSGAVLWHSGGHHTEAQLRRIVDHKIPIVLMDRHPETFSCDFVGVDNVYSAREAVEYLVSLGHSRIGVLATLEPITSIEERIAGYRTAVERAGLPLSDDLEFRLSLTHSLTVSGLDTELNAIAKTIKTMADPPTAIFAMNDFQAHHLINALASQGLSVPDDVSVIGFDDVDRYSPRPPFLTTMRQSFEAMGERAAELLLRRIASAAESIKTPAAHQHILLPTKLVVRQSCRDLNTP